MVQSVHDPNQLLISHSGKILLLGDILSDQSIHVFVCRSFPGSIGMSKKEINPQGTSHPLMISKLLDNICRKGVQMICNRLKQLNNRITHLVRCALINLGQQAKTRFAIGQGYNGLAVSFDDDGIHFPTANPGAFRNDCWALFNAHPIGYSAAPVITVISFTALLLVAQVTIQITSRLFIRQDVLVYPFMTDLERMMPPQPSSDLLRAPILTQFQLNPVPQFFRDALAAVILAAKRFMICLFWPIAALTFVPAQFATDGRFVLPNQCCDFGLVISHFQQHWYLCSRVSCV